MRRLLAATAFAGWLLTFGAGSASAQTSAVPQPSASPASPALSVDPSSHEARAAVARTVRVRIDILGITPGMRVAEARAKLAQLADPKTPAVQEGGFRKDKDKDDDEEGMAKQGAKNPAQRAPEARAKDDDDEEGGGTKILWKLVAGSPYEWVFIEADKDDKIGSVNGYCWPDKPIPFDDIGDVAKAPLHSATHVAWDSLRPPLHYRIVADGAKESAAQVSVALVWIPTNGVRRSGRAAPGG